MKFAGVVVTYNRKEDLLKNIINVLKQEKQFDKFFIIDNCSTDGTYEYLKEHKIFEYKNIKFITLKKNIGGAGGFYIGLKYAYKSGCDFICLMDDDGRPLLNNTFSILFTTAENLYIKHKKMMINSLVVCDDAQNKLSFGLGTMIMVKEVKKREVNGLIEDLINPFNGTLITRELIDSIGFPNKDFFIRGDEVDYQCRAKKSGAYIATVTNSVYYHPYAELSPLKWKENIVYFGICPPWKGYYLVRNYIFRIKRDNGNIAAIKEFIFQLYATMVCNPEAMSCIKLLFKGFADGMRGKLGMVVKPGDK